MASSGSNSAGNLDKMRHRRMKRIKRQRAIEAGKSVDLAVKGMALDSAQKKELSGIQSQAPSEQKRQASKRSGVSVLASVVVHAIVVSIAALYVVKTTQVEDEAVSVEFFQEILEKRDPPKREVRVRPTPKPTRQPQTLKQPVLKPVVNLPTTDPGFVLPDESLDNVPDLGPSDGGAGIDTSRFDANRLGPVQPKINTGNPEDLLRQRRDDSSLGSFGDPPDIDEPEQADPADRDAFKPQEVTRRPRWRNQVEPKYPSAARRAQKEGRVILEATIDVDGKAKDIKVKKDDVGFGCSTAAIEALESSRFSPAKRGEENVAMRISIPYQFKLED